MIAFEVLVNDRSLCVAGVGDEGILHANVTHMARLEENSVRTLLHVGGLANREHLRWLDGFHALEIGDEVRIRVLESSSADPAVRRFPQEDRSDPLSTPETAE